LAARFSPRPGPGSRACAGLAGFVLVLLLSGASAGAAEQATPPPEAAAASIGELHEVLLGVMKEADALGFSGRLERIRPVLSSLYDFPFMAEKSVGLGWRELDEAARARLVDAFSRLAIATYAARFDGYDGDQFETLGVQPASHGTALVKTRIVRGNGETVSLDYRMRPEGGRWRIIDVFLNGTVSELALRRSEYSGVLRREGFDALLQAIEQKIAAQERGGQEAASAQP
jgi:phospholipid transport system substrate-binding protein